MTLLSRLTLPALLALALGLAGPAAFAQEAAPTPAEAGQAADIATEPAPGPEPATGPAAEAAADAAAPAEAVPATAAAAEAESVEAGHHAPIPFFSLYNTNFVVLIAFLLFVGILLYLKVPGTLGSLLDRRAAAIRKELEDARKLREEAQTLLASFERKQKDVREQAERIVASARADAEAAAEKARAQIALDIERRLKGAEEQIASARAAAIRDVRNRAAEVAAEVAGTVLAGQMDAARANALIDDAIDQVKTRLN